MPESSNNKQDVQAEILAAIRKSQVALVEGIKRVSGAIQAHAPSIQANLPYADRLPKPEKLAATASGLAGQVLARQRRLAGSVLAAARPLVKAAKDAAAGKSDTTPK
ncbi:MAG TPA: hypothetical protein VG253_23080 [Streptosporangiaceae bacterium]|jgi:hypothetical protein|nr:hypothetical protein [Streptosporangiaceae bacterium]